MNLRIKIANLVDGNFAGRGNNILISQIWIVDDNGEHIKAIKLNEDVIDVLKQSNISVERDGENVSPKVDLFG